MSKYRCDTSETQADGAVLWYSQWLGGPTLAKITNCRVDLVGDMRRTVEITSEPDTFFSIPARTKIGGKHVNGYVSCDDDNNLVFRARYY
jgi:hypothetical protein